ncbi:M20 family metallopeptidase [Thermofilum pendens]|nr:M20 family metallopeptidase [Thermofilum pendens]
MTVDVVQSLVELVKIPSEVYYEGNRIVRRYYREAAEAVARLAETHGLRVEKVDLEGGEIPTVIASLPGKASGKPSVAFVTHYDVVPAKGPWVVEGRTMDPYSPLVLDGKVYGRGAADDKSGIVATIAGLVDIREAGIEPRYNPVVVVTGDEEVGGTGIRRLLEKGYRWDYVIIVDSGSEYVSVGASGVVHGWIKVKGKSGHAGYPHVARNAVEDLVRVLGELMELKTVRGARLSKYPSPPGSPVPYVWGRLTFNILRLPPTEPEKHNRIPGEAWCGFDMRLLPEEDVEEAVRELYAKLSSIAMKLGVSLEVEIIGKQKGWYSKNEAFVREVLTAAGRSKGREVPVAAELGGNDGTFFDEYGMDVVAFGTIREGTNIHSEGEHVYVEDIEAFRKFMYEFLKP